MYRIGIIGTDSSHVTQYVRMLNVEHRFPARVVALTDGSPERLCELAVGGAEVTADVADLVGRVDAVIVASRDGREHRALAEPALRAGLPVFVDKPFTVAPADAQALVDTARAHGAALTSLSAMRFAAEVRDVVETDVGDPRLLVVSGPADPDSEHAGLAFSGSHVTEIAHEVLGRPRPDGPLVPDVVTQDGDTIVAVMRVADVHCVLTFITPGAVRVPFHVSLTGTRGTVAGEIDLPANYLLPVLETVVSMVGTGRPPMDPRALLLPVAMLDAVCRQL